MTFQSQLWLKRKYFQFTAARLLHQPSFIYTTMHTLLGKIYTICLLCRPCGFGTTPNNLPVSTKLSALNKRLLWSPLPALLAHNELRTTGDRIEQKPQQVVSGPGFTLDGVRKHSQRLHPWDHRQPQSYAVTCPYGSTQIVWTMPGEVNRVRPAP